MRVAGTEYFSISRVCMAILFAGIFYAYFSIDNCVKQNSLRQRSGFPPHW